ncbi:hypothetical protein PMIN01_09443 [Paraphaeosphaeria minitans]|uniref:Uncharacterized protein n=1 Tax=Paraphaeosphaeria minitans TaxID=565426 RepID=A0A9P6GCN3_9PLEO|nr:hypothetical protein PMIN01_09443 [Paraphaeosphaeria minitans]
MESNYSDDLDDITRRRLRHAYFARKITQETIPSETTTKESEPDHPGTLEYVVAVADEQDELSQFQEDDDRCRFVRQLPMVSKTIHLSMLKIGNAAWYRYSPLPMTMDVSMLVNDRIYCIQIPENARKSNAITYPAEKQYLRCINSAVTFNRNIVIACLNAGWRVAWAHFERTPESYASMQQYYGLPESPMVGPGYGYGGYWIDGDNIDSSEILVRWLIRKEVWEKLPSNERYFVNRFSTWGVLKEHSHQRPPSGTDPEPMPSRRVQYSLVEVDMLQYRNPEDDAQA